MESKLGLSSIRLPKFLLCILTIAAAGLLTGCKPREVTCNYDEAYNDETGECYRCPKGTKVDYQTATCVPIGTEDIIDPDSAEGDASPPDVILPPDETDRVDTGPDVQEAQEQRGGDSAPGGSTGAACKMDADCFGGGLCFDWPGGYCISPDCQSDDDCPEGSFCLPLLDNGQACFDACLADSECRSGYGCKGVPTLQGEPKFICHPIGEEKKGLGTQCAEHSECDGSLACVSLGPASMCTRTGCSTFDPCPSSSECMIWGMMTLCLPTCGMTEDCADIASDQFTCQEMDNIEGEDVSVCSPMQQGLPIGELCFFSTECSTGYCHLLISGKCSGANNYECGSDGECDEGLCITDRSVQKGVCAKPCGPGDGCPGGAYCVMTDKGPFCMSACDNYSEECGPVGFSMFCTYGKLYYPAAPSGKYACSKSFAGDAGAPCKAPGDCISGTCYGADLESGYCATECVTDNECPFGSLCQPDTLVSGQAYCTRICYSDLDCMAGFSCKNTYYSEKACVM